DEQKEVVPDAQKVVIEESDKDVKKGGTNLKTDVDQFVMIVQKHYKKLVMMMMCLSEKLPLVARRTNPRRAHRSTIDPTQEQIRGKSESKRERINAKDFILPDEWATKIHARVKGNSSGYKDTDKQKEVVLDAQKIAVEESDKELKKDDEVIKNKREAFAIETTNDPLVASRTNPRRAHRTAIDPPQELIRGKSASKSERINVKDFILPDSWATKSRIRVKENNSGHKDTVN
ncbi:hypothetical protein HAX54_042418, partial [Datura stramonium]|nr:hypothetical protein [Datura stramonium]